MAGRGLDLGGHRATELSRAVLARADLILVMAREHTGVVLAWERSAGRRTFSLRSFARAIDGQEASSPEGLVDLANEVGDDRPDDDVADPVGQGRAAHEACATLLDDEVRPIVAALAKASIGR
jgi:protein-tyrosine phosphatase